MHAALTSEVPPAVDAWLESADVPTPYLVVDLDEVRRQYDRLAAAAPSWTVHYAVKALPERPIVEVLAERGCHFDVASRAESQLCLSAGVDPAALSYGNTVKKPADIAATAAMGVRLFSFDCLDELRKLATVAQRLPAAEQMRVMCRVLVDTSGSDWPLGAKFGCAPELAVDLLVRAADHGLTPWGVAFHVGSQQRRPSRWVHAVDAVAAIYREVADRGISMPAINIGGGLPAHYLEPVPTLDEYVSVIDDGLSRAFHGAPPQVIAEPGRYLVADAGVLRTQVVTVATKHVDADVRWVFVDTGRYGALAETAGEAIRYRLRTPHDGLGGDVGPVVLAGPTCDSADILYQRHRYQLPLALRAGDHIDWLSAGAYTTCYSAAWFNGLTPPPVYFVNDSEPTASAHDPERRIGRASSSGRGGQERS